MGNKVSYLLICVLAILVISACIPSNTATVPQIGDKVPNISWTTISGEKIDLNQFKGSWVLLCYWCSCTEHRNEILSIRDVYDAIYDKNIKVVVCDDTDGIYISLKEFAAENNLPFYMVKDNQNTINKIILVAKTRPIYFLIDTNGILYATNLSFHYDGKDIDNVISFLIDVIKVKIDDITITNITEHGATIRCRTDKAVRCSIESDKVWCGYENEERYIHELLIDCCRPNRIYSFTIVADGLYEYPLRDNPQFKNSMNTNTSSNEFTFTTLTAPILSNAKISKITDSSAEIYWETDVETSGTATIYTYTFTNGIEVRQDTDFKADYEFTKKHSFTVGYLKPNQGYSVDLESKDRNLRSDTYEFWFKTQPLNYKLYGVEIFNINIYDITDKSAEITWSTDRVVSCWGCFPHLCTTGDEPSRDHSHTITRLEPDTEYWIQVGTILAGVSDVFNFKTLKVNEKVDMK